MPLPSREGEGELPVILGYLASCDGLGTLHSVAHLAMMRPLTHPVPHPASQCRKAILGGDHQTPGNLLQLLGENYALVDGDIDVTRLVLVEDGSQLYGDFDLPMPHMFIETVGFCWF